MNRILQEDIVDFAKNCALANDIHNSSFLITGTTGLIGSTLIHCLMALKQNIQIIAPVRNINKANKEIQCYDGITLVECDLETVDFIQFGHVDYIIHCAAPTSSKYFVEYPVETYYSICNISAHILEYARLVGIKSMVYLSSLEVYGQILDDLKPVTEDAQGYLDLMDVRSSYPMAKRTVENLCCLYASEYKVPIKVARLTQTTGAGCSLDDNRIIAQFARLAVQGEDIVLRTTGESSRPYCYTTDAVSALLYILLKGKNGEAYNVANEQTYISAKNMAYFVKKHINPSISIKFYVDNNCGYAPVTKQKLSTNKLESLGWKPYYSLESIFKRLSLYFNTLK